MYFKFKNRTIIQNTFQMKLLEGKTAVITGAGRGIGRGIALKLGEHGANIAFSDMMYDDNAKSLEMELQAMGVKAKGYASDASKFDDSHKFADEVVQEFGRVDILVNNAGITRDQLLM